MEKLYTVTKKKTGILKGEIEHEKHLIFQSKKGFNYLKLY